MEPFPLSSPYEYKGSGHTKEALRTYISLLQKRGRPLNRLNAPSRRLTSHQGGRLASARMYENSCKAEGLSASLSLHSQHLDLFYSFERGMFHLPSKVMMNENHRIIAAGCCLQRSLGCRENPTAELDPDSIWRASNNTGCEKLTRVSRTFLSSFHVKTNDIMRLKCQQYYF